MPAVSSVCCVVMAPIGRSTRMQKSGNTWRASSRWTSSFTTATARWNESLVSVSLSFHRCCYCINITARFLCTLCMHNFVCTLLQKITHFLAHSSCLLGWLNDVLSVFSLFALNFFYSLLGGQLSQD